jgi:hypothetical protein
VIEAAAKLSSWLSSREAVACVARHLGYPTENARLRIVRYVRVGRITRGRTAEGWLVSLFPAAWHEGADLDAANLELGLDELIAADLLPAPGGLEGPAERAWQPADRAVAYLIKGYLVEWGDWTPEMGREVERGEIKLGEAIRDGRLSARGQKSLQAPIEQIPCNDFRSEMVAMKVFPVDPSHPPKVVVRVDGKVGVSPRHQLPGYTGHPWCLIEVDWAGLKPLRARGAAEPVPPLSKLEPPPKPELAKAESIRWQRDRAINAIKTLHPPDGIRPKTVSIAALTERINKLTEFKADKVSADTVGRADIEIKEAKAHKK